MSPLSLISHRRRRVTNSFGFAAADRCSSAGQLYEGLCHLGSGGEATKLPVSPCHLAVSLLALLRAHSETSPSSWLLYGDEDSAAQATTTLQSAQCQSLNGHSFEVRGRSCAVCCSARLRTVPLVADGRLSQALFLGPPDKVLEEEDEQRLCARMIQLLSEQDSSAIANLGLPPRAPTPPQVSQLPSIVSLAPRVDH